jgi:hypothetical protein
MPSFLAVLGGLMAVDGGFVASFGVFWRFIGGLLAVYWRFIGGLLAVYWRAPGGRLARIGGRQ